MWRTPKIVFFASERFLKGLPKVKDIWNTKYLLLRPSKYEEALLRGKKIKNIFFLLKSLLSKKKGHKGFAMKISVRFLYKVYKILSLERIPLIGIVCIVISQRVFSLQNAFKRFSTCWRPLKCNFRLKNLHMDLKYSAQCGSCTIRKINNLYGVSWFSFINISPNLIPYTYKRNKHIYNVVRHFI